MEMAVDYANLGTRVRKQREKKRMTQEQLASVADMSKQHLSNVENAKSRISLEKVVNLANALECSVDDLLCDSVETAKIVYENEVVGMIESFSDVEMRALPEFLRSYCHFSKLMEKSLQQKDV